MHGGETASVAAVSLVGIADIEGKRGSREMFEGSTEASMLGISAKEGAISSADIRSMSEAVAACLMSGFLTSVEYVL